ncbi:MAG: DUF192 domain-containing protein [Holophagaceae bacterium]|nr:DUF192 domain-containing protein [Holophagaceae bacterium]
MRRTFFFSLATILLMFSNVACANTDVDGGYVIAKGKRFLAEVARTANERARGLMYRQQLQSDRCMFFVYDQDDYHSIWMKNCLISLDVAWINTDGTVVEIAENVPPCSPLRGDDCPSFGGTVLSRHFIEFQAGTFKRLGLKVGDKVGWDLKFSNGKSSKGGLPIANKTQPTPARAK